MAGRPVTETTACIRGVDTGYSIHELPALSKGQGFNVTHNRRVFSRRHADSQVVRVLFTQWTAPVDQIPIRTTHQLSA